ncbi:transcription factor AS1-like [Andrographis paniculata]|uniref:transcription factor AS1-like n=1 Tax=Andrographis paniculata TaxID=175694 RepID=UPI0021E7F7BD|nr:transcription factor AS1-like [Andrographis paniculata]
MKERQRWQPEEDALLRAYVKQYGPKEWNLISQRMGKTLDRDPKSCLERWKNYLKPGIKKGSLTPEEQSLVISLQARYGNKWKKIAAEVPGRTAKRLGKWWEVFKEKQLKAEQHKSRKTNQIDYAAAPGTAAAAAGSSSESAAQGKYDHILETFAEKYVQPKMFSFQSPAAAVILPGAGIPLPVPEPPPPPPPPPPPVLSLGSEPSNCAAASLLPWMNLNTTPPKTASSLTTTTSSSSTPSPSVSLTLSPSEPAVLDPEPPCRLIPFQQQLSLLIQHCKELEEGRETWLRHKKEATWRLTRLEQQLESEKARRRKEKKEETEAAIRRLREEEASYISRLEGEYREQMKAVQREAEAKEAKLMEAWCSNHVKLGKVLDQVGAHGGHGCSAPASLSLSVSASISDRPPI